MWKQNYYFFFPERIFLKKAIFLDFCQDNMFCDHFFLNQKSLKY